MEQKTELQKNAIAAARHKELDTFQRALDVQWMNSRMDDGRMGRCLALIKREADMEKDFRERTDHAAIVNARATKETALGMAIAKNQQEETQQFLRRHYLRERDPALRQLQQKLQAAYVCRDLRQQIQHNEYKRLQDKADDLRSSSVLRNTLFTDQEALEVEEKKKMQQTREYCKELQQQLVNKQREKQCQFEDTLIEKKMLEQVMKTLSDEDMKELQQKREQMQKLRDEMVKSQHARKAWKDKQKALVIQEEKKLEEQLAAASDRSSSLIAERERKRQVKEELNEKVARKILEEEAARAERVNVIKLLQEQELLEKNINDDIAEKEKLERVKNETKEALTRQMEEHKRQETEQKKRESDFRKNTEAKLDADHQKELEKERKQRERRQQYSAALRQQITENAARKKEQERSEEERNKSVFAYERQWDAEVARERKKIIEEHVPHLLGYMQAGVIKKEDLPAVREGANKHEDLAKLDIESMAISRRPHRFSKCNAQCRILREY